MNKENENAIFDAADVICLNCVEDTLNDNSVCENCPVRKLCNSLLGIKKQDISNVGAFI